MEVTSASFHVDPFQFRCKIHEPFISSWLTIYFLPLQQGKKYKNKLNLLIQKCAEFKGKIWFRARDFSLFFSCGCWM